MKTLSRFILLTVLLSLAPALRADRITVNITITNAPAALTNSSYTLNGSTRTWSNATTATRIAITNSILQAATNLYNQLATYPLTGSFAYFIRTNTISVLANNNVALTGQVTGAWAIFQIVTNPVVQTGNPLLVDNTTVIQSGQTNFFTANRLALSNEVAGLNFGVGSGWQPVSGVLSQISLGNGVSLVSNVVDATARASAAAKQPVSGVLSNLALGNGVNLISNVTDTTKQPVSGVLSNLALGNASGIASNLTGTSLTDNSVNSNKFDAATRARLDTAGGATPGGFNKEIQINNGAGGLAAVPGFFYDGSYLSVTNDSGTLQVYLRLKGNDGLQNVPFRVSTDTDVPADFCTINQDMSLLAVSCDPTDSSGHADPSGQNIYFGIRSISAKTMAFYGGDSSRNDWTIYNGADGVSVSSSTDYNLMHQGPTTIHGNGTISGNLNVSGTITGGGLTGGATNLNQIQVIILTNHMPVTLATNLPLQFLELRQNGVGGFTNTWPAGVVWPGGTLPTITTNADRADYFQFMHDRTNWLGAVLGQNYPVVTNVTAGGGGGGSALSLNGASGANATVVASSDFDLPVYTVELWIKSSSVPSGANKGLVSNKDGAYIGFNMGIGDGGTLYYDANASDYGQTAALGAGFFDGATWHHLAITYDGADINYWVDGVLSNTVTTGGAAISSSGTLEIGDGTAAGFGEFTGAIDSARISSGAVYTVDFSGDLPTCLTNVSGVTVGLWQFDEGTGTSVADDSDNTHTATLNGAATWETGNCAP